MPISAEAARWILEKLEFVRQSPGMGEHVPVLGACFGWQVRDEDRIVSRYSALSFDLGWYPPGSNEIDGYPEVEICGRMLAVEPHAFDLLKGKELVLETVDVGYPDPVSTTHEVLRCQG